MFQLKFDDLVLTSEEVKAFSLEEFLFDNSIDVDESDEPLDDDFVNPPSRRPVPKAVSSSVHKSKVAHIIFETTYWPSELNWEKSANVVQGAVVIGQGPDEYDEVNECNEDWDVFETICHH